jgi:acetyl-CoA synthetase
MSIPAPRAIWAYAIQAHELERRILRKIAEDDFGSLGDTSTRADPAVVEDLIANRQNKKE